MLHSVHPQQNQYLLHLPVGAGLQDKGEGLWGKQDKPWDLQDRQQEQAEVVQVVAEG